MKKNRQYPAEVKERAVRLVQENQREYSSQWAAICSITEKFDCSSETFRKWVRKACTSTAFTFYETRNVKSPVAERTGS